MNPEGKVRHKFGTTPGLKPGKGLTQLLAEARIEALEEAAKVAEDKAPVTQDMWGTELAEKCDEIAAAIRALKDKT